MRHLVDLNVEIIPVSCTLLRKRKSCKLKALFSEVRAGL